MKILVTGGAGFIGSHIVEHYQGKAEILVLDNLRTGRSANLENLPCEFVHGSILDRDLVAKLMIGVTHVFHMAALVSVPESMLDPVETVKINVQGLLNVLEAARAAQVRKLVFTSSAAIYGEDPRQPKLEDMRPDPRSPYAVTKLDGEYYCALYHREGWLPTASLRLFNVFGPRQDPRSAYAAAVPTFVARARSGETIEIHGDGEQTRDFVYVKDVARAFAFAAETPALSGTFNVGYGSAISIRQLVEEICRAAHSRSAVVHGPSRAGDLRHSLADASKLRAAGWEPAFDQASGLADMLRRSD